MTFAGVGEEGLIQVCDVFKTTATPGDYDTIGSGAPELQILNADGVNYTRYYYTSDAYDADGNEVTGWANSADDISYEKYPTGTAFWYWSRGSKGSITFPGQVDESASSTKDANKGYSLIGNPYPTMIKLTDIVCTNIEPGDYDSIGSGAPEIQFLNADGVNYTRFYYTSDAYDKDGNEVTGWANSADDIVYDAVAPVTAGFWLWNRGSTDGTVTIMNPIAK